MDDPPEVIQLCLSCTKPDCDGGARCVERIAMMRKLAGRKAPIRVEHGGISLPLSEWAKLCGVSYQRLYTYIVMRGKDPDEVLNRLYNK